MKRDTLIVGAVIAAICAAILAASVVCTWAIAHGASMQWRLLFKVFCHGIPHRCLYLWGVPMPICARCTAIYAGALIGLGAFAMWCGRGRPLFMSERASTLMLYVAAIPMGIDGLTQLTTLRESTNPLRIATGIVAGLGFTIWALSTVERHASPAVETVRSSS